MVNLVYPAGISQYHIWPPRVAVKKFRHIVDVTGDDDPTGRPGVVLRDFSRIQHDSV